MSPHEDWYVKKQSGILAALFKERSIKLPITEDDRIWETSTLRYFSKLIGRDDFKQLITITPEKQFFDREFDGSEEDGKYVFRRLKEILKVDIGEIDLLYYSEWPKYVVDNIRTIPEEKLDIDWVNSLSKYIENNTGQSELWLKVELLQNTEQLIAVMAYMLVRYKLINAYGFDDKYEHAISLAAVAYGFGIFMGNSLSKFSRWEIVIAYAMAWLANYRNEDISWKKYLNKTMLKYFDKCYKYLSNEKSS